MQKNTKVKCDVESCQHNTSKCCSLDNLDISCTCDHCNCHDQKETICCSFKEK